MFKKGIFLTKSHIIFYELLLNIFYGKITSDKTILKNSIKNILKV